MNNQDYKRLCNFLNDFLSRNKQNENTFFISWPHLLRYHDQEIKNYKNLNISFFQRAFFKIIKLITQIFYRLEFFDGSKQYIKKLNKQNLNTIVISHMINPNQLAYKKDFYFPDIAMTQNTLTCMINHTKFSNEVLSKKLPSNTIIISRNSDLKTNISIFFKCIKGFIDTQFQKSKKNHLFFKILKKIQNESLSSSTFLNHSFKKKIKNIIKEVIPQKVIFTYEGYPYEKIIISAAREVSTNIKCVGYQHSGIFKSQNVVYKSFDQKYDPDYVLCTGKITAEHCKKKIENKETIVKVLGTQKRFDLDLNKRRKSCLIVPEGYFSELKILLKFCIKISLQDSTIPFILRLHPNTYNDKKIKSYVTKRLKLFDNFEISNTSLKNDLMKSKTVLYRGSTVAVQAGCLGIIPLYLKYKSEMSIDPLFNMGESKLKIKKVDEFLSIHRNFRDKKFKVYCQNYYAHFDKTMLKHI